MTKGKTEWSKADGHLRGREMKIQISDRYAINTKKTHPLIKLISIPILALLALAAAGAMLFFAWYAYALVTR